MTRSWVDLVCPLAVCQLKFAKGVKFAMIKLSLDEQKELIERIKQGDREAAELLIRAYTPLVCLLAKRYNRPDIYDDLVQEGYCGLLQAADKYNTGLGVSFVTLAFYWVKRNMDRFIIKSSSVKVSAHVKLSDIPKVASLDAPVENSNGDKEICLGDTLQSNNNVESEVEFKIMLEKIIETLTEEEKKILLLRVKGYTFKQIADELGISERQMNFRLKKMRTKLQELQEQLKTA